MRASWINNTMAPTCSMANLMRLFIGIMLLATQFAIHGQCVVDEGQPIDKGQAPGVVDQGQRSNKSSEVSPASNTTSTEVSPASNTASPEVKRSSFPDGFVFGSASSAYQVEGAAKKDGKSDSIWDTYSHTPGNIDDHSNGDKAVDQYHRFEEDIWLMKGVGMDAYRFSISWPRILPNGKDGEVNPEGVAYYNRLIDTLLHHGIQPYATLFHWDLPQVLETSFKGWVGREIIAEYEQFARVSFESFGDRVKHWITFNEVHQFAKQGYRSGTLAPGRCTPGPESKCTEGDSSTEPYLVTHHCLNAHAAAVKIYRNEFEGQNGVIGMTADSTWYEPLEDNIVDRAAAQRAMEFELGWLLDPIVFGEYPLSMRQSLGTRLPKFTDEEKERIRGSYDFIGFNHYTSEYATIDNSSASNENNVTVTKFRNGELIGVQGGSKWLHVVPYGMRKSLEWIRRRYPNPPIYITENGVDELNQDKTQPLLEQLSDKVRVTYYKGYIEQLLIAIRAGSNVKGYFAWSFLDNFEWSIGYTVRFGIFYVDYNNDLARYPKESAYWFQKMLSE